MDKVIYCLPLLNVGLPFTVLGVLKIYGLSRGLVGGREKPMACRLMGSCPSWSRGVNILMTLMFCAIGVGNLTMALALLLAR
jgi:hypothetical protein